MANAEQISVTVVYALPHEQVQVAVTLPRGSTLQDAVAASGLAARFADISGPAVCFGIFGKLEKAPASRILQSGERVEIYRSLLIDPKEARKARAAKAKARRA